jgi:hypothetical protein
MSGGMAARYRSGYLAFRRLTRRSLGDRKTPSPGMGPHPRSHLLLSVHLVWYTETISPIGRCIAKCPHESIVMML